MDFPQDFLNQPIKPGRKIVYTTNRASSPRFTLARVVEITSDKIKVKRLRDSYGGLKPEGLGDTHYRTLTNPKAIVVVHPDAT